LIFLSLTVALAEFPVLAMEDRPRQAVASLAPVQLHQHAATLRFIVKLG
jgi:hypothetical protein